jgi:hypothetical protein
MTKTPLRTQVFSCSKFYDAAGDKPWRVGTPADIPAPRLIRFWRYFRYFVFFCVVPGGGNAVGALLPGA